MVVEGAKFDATFSRDKPLRIAEANGGMARRVAHQSTGNDRTASGKCIDANVA